MLGIIAPPQPKPDVTAGHLRVVLGDGYSLPADVSSLASAPSGGESWGWTSARLGHRPLPTGSADQRQRDSLRQLTIYRSAPSANTIEGEMTDNAAGALTAAEGRAADRITAEARRRRTFAVISHPDAGKSTLTEALVLHANVITEAGAIHGKAGRRATVSDWMEMEKARGISITSTALQFPYRAPSGQDCVINLLDTPGHADFSEDTYRVLTAVDCAVMLIDAAKGLEPQTLKLFEVCRLRRIPIITVINKWDRPGRDALELIGRDPGQDRPAAHPADVAGRHRRRLQGRARPTQRQLHPVHPHRRRRQGRTRGAHRPGRRARRRGRRLGQRRRGVRTAGRRRLGLRPRTRSSAASRRRCCSPPRR